MLDTQFSGHVGKIVLLSVDILNMLSNLCTIHFEELNYNAYGPNKRRKYQ